MDPDRYQALAPDGATPSYPDGYPTFDGRQLGTLAGVVLKAFNSRPEASDFYSLWTLGAFACSLKATALVGDRMKKYGELLETGVEDGERVHIFNCTNLLDCLDGRRTNWEIGARSGTRVRVLRYWFRRDRLPPVGTLFKVLQTAGKEVLTIDDPDDPESGFVSEARRAGLVGLGLVPLDNFARHNEAMWGFDPRFQDAQRR